MGGRCTAPVLRITWVRRYVNGESGVYYAHRHRHIGQVQLHQPFAAVVHSMHAPKGQAPACS